MVKREKPIILSFVKQFDNDLHSCKSIVIHTNPHIMKLGHWVGGGGGGGGGGGRGDCCLSVTTTTHEAMALQSNNVSS